ncbi:MAG: hypothetical protein Q4A25_03010 [Candidatus Saccharibacteria bacterium]|nr:hypothetical protein [Candidatus Saccharibacteria bacterium]
MEINYGSILLWFFIAYLIAVLVTSIHNMINIFIFHMKFDPKNILKCEAYEKTRPFHALYDIVIFPFCAYFCLQSQTNPDAGTAFIIGLIWLTISMVSDWLIWVAIKTPARHTYKEFYIDYQPWLALCYLVTLFSPLVTFLIVR